MNRLLLYGLMMKKSRWGFNGRKNRIVKRKREIELLQPCSRKSRKLERNEQCIKNDGKEDSGEQDDELLKPCSRIHDNIARNGEAITEDAKHMSKSKSLEMSENSMTYEEVDISDENFNLCGIPLPPLSENNKSQVTFVLENASLAIGSIGKRDQILNPDEHGDFLRKKHKNPYNYRPDIVHRTLLGIMDSPLRMAAQLLQKFHIKGKGGHGKLLRLVRAPVTDHLPVNALRIGFSFSAAKKIPFRDYLSLCNIDQELVFVVGVMAHGKIECDYIDDLISICGYHLSAAACVKTVCTLLQRKWSIR